ncbi:MAG: DUF4886 domain-containing protein [Clostridia bacterium]|nr:DUF4886 domain-containing protein [Clostridia bacterium]
MRKWVALIVSIALLACAVPAVTTGAGTEPIRILAIGNSYSNNATQLTEFIAESLEEELNVEFYSLYYAGCSLSQHVKYYTENLPVYELFRRGTSLYGGAATPITMQTAFDLHDYDYVTIQQSPGGAAQFSTYWTESNPYLTQLQDIIEENEPQAQIKIHQTWSYSLPAAQGSNPYSDRVWENTRIMYNEIKEGYELAAAKMGLTNADIIPVGTAMQLAKDEYGYGDFYNESGVGRMENGALYEDFISHLNLRSRYMAACVWLEYFFGVDCRKATYVHSSLTEEDCVVLRKIAHEVVTGETDTVVGDWRVLPNGDGVKLVHYMGTVPANGTVTLPETVGEKDVNAVSATIFKYVDGLQRIVLPTSAETWEIEEGSFPVEPYDVAAGTVIGNGALTFSVDSADSAALAVVEEGTVVTVKAAPANGYLLKPGSLTYTTASGKTVAILNKTMDLANNTFGEGDGNTFQFVMPNEQVMVNAEFISTENNSFAFDTIGSSVHVTEDNRYDGIRFLTRLNFGTFDDTAESLTVTYGGNTYTVTGIGMLLKRAENTAALTLESYAGGATGLNTIWNAVAYDKETSDLLKVVDYTDSYIDVQVMMQKGESTSFSTFKTRQFAARGYVILTDANGVDTVLYSDTTLTKCVKDIVPSLPLKPEFGDIELQ